MKILIVSFYYPPDLGAGAFRVKALVDALAEHGEGVEVEVLTALPHRYSSHRPDAPRRERIDNVLISRFPIPLDGGRKLALARAYFSFWRHCRRRVAGRSADVVVASASRLVPAWIGADLARRLGARLHVDLRDLFALNLSDVHPQWWWAPVRRAASAMESHVIERADRISVVSPGFEPFLLSRRPASEISVHVNGFDDCFLPSGDRAPRESGAGGEIQIVYAGNIGHGQALDSIIPQLAKRLRGRARFTLYGDGGGRATLEAALRESGLDNVSLEGTVSRSRLPDIYSRADVLFLHLGRHDAFGATIPSKVFEYAVSGRPIWAGVSGESARLLDSQVPNSAVFSPGDAGHALEVLAQLEICHTPRPDFVRKYARTNVARAMADEILELARRDRVPDA